MNENQLFIKKCFENLIKKNVITEDDIKPSTITDEDIKKVEERFNIRFPEFYKDFLKTYFFEFEVLSGVVDGIGYYKEQELNIIQNDSQKMKILTDVWIDMESELHFLENGYVMIGDWGNGWGPLCFDMSKRLEDVVYDDPDTWTLVYFDHEYFWGSDKHDDFVEALEPAAPDFRELMEWFFMDKYIDEDY